MLKTIKPNSDVVIDGTQSLPEIIKDIVDAITGIDRK